MTDMNDETLTALKASIVKWEANAAVNDLENATMGPETCPLCQLFHNYFCDGCPVFAAVDERRCVKTPYNKCYDAHDLRRLTAFKAAALKEVAFLKSLLPQEAGL